MPLEPNRSRHLLQDPFVVRPGMQEGQRLQAEGGPIGPPGPAVQVQDAVVPFLVEDPLPVLEYWERIARERAEAARPVVP